MVGNSASKPLNSTLIEILYNYRFVENCIKQIEYFKMIFLNIYKCGNNAHFHKSGHIYAYVYMLGSLLHFLHAITKGIA